jgi:hypothetical protein
MSSEDPWKKRQCAECGGVFAPTNPYRKAALEQEFCDVECARKGAGKRSGARMRGTRTRMTCFSPDVPLWLQVTTGRVVQPKAERLDLIHRVAAEMGVPVSPDLEAPTRKPTPAEWAAKQSKIAAGRRARDAGMRTAWNLLARRRSK